MIPPPPTGARSSRLGTVLSTLLLAAACAAGPDEDGGAAERLDPPTTAHDPVAMDSARILEDLRYLSSDGLGGRAPGTPGSALARERVAGAFEAAGVHPFGAGLADPFDDDRGGGVNVVGRISGTDPNLPWIVVTAHYDHVGTRDGEVFNGADDNASGTAALMFLARELTTRPLRHPVALAALDAEERGLMGARAFVADPPVPLGRIALNVNLDMLSRGDGELWAAGAHHTPELAPILEEVAADAPVRLLLGHDRPGAPEGADWTQSSDHGPFHDRGIPFVYFGVDDHPDVHRATDDFERIDPGDYLAAVRTVLQALRALDEALASGALEPAG